LDDGDNPLTVKGTVDIAGPKITYKLFDDKNNDGVCPQVKLNLKL